jgi:putative transposase
MRVFEPVKGKEILDECESQEASYARADHRAAAREADAMLSAGQTIAAVCQKLSISEQTYHRWRNTFGGMKADAMKQLKQLREENRRLKKAVADLTLDKQILKEANAFLGNG